MLNKQYRMPNEIGTVISELFYNGHLKNHRVAGESSIFCARMNILDFSKIRGIVVIVQRARHPMRIKRSCFGWSG